MRRFIIPSLAALIAATSPVAIAQQDDNSSYREVYPENLLIMTLESGEVVIELNEDFAPGHVEQMRELISSGIYDGERFYRVIDGFVAQGGLEVDERIEVYPTLTNENERMASDEDFVPLGNEDLFAPVVGHLDGFAVGRNPEAGTEWLLHCPGAMAMARGVDPDSGSTEFYIVLDAQRYLDRNLTVFGRVLSGMEHIQALKRGDRAIESGVIQRPERGDEILTARLAVNIPEEERPRWEVLETTSEDFEAFKTRLRVRTDEFFYNTPPEILDVCAFSAPAREISEE